MATEDLSELFDRMFEGAKELLEYLDTIITHPEKETNE